MFDGPGEVSHSRSGSRANTDHGGPQLESVVEEVTLNSCVANPEVGNQPRNATWCPHRPDFLYPTFPHMEDSGFSSAARPQRSRARGVRPAEKACCISARVVCRR